MSESSTVCVQGEAEETDEESVENEPCATREKTVNMTKEEPPQEKPPVGKVENKLTSFAQWKFRDINMKLDHQAVDRYTDCCSDVTSTMGKVSKMLDNSQTFAMLASKNIRGGIDRLKGSSRHLCNIHFTIEDMPKVKLAH